MSIFKNRKIAKLVVLFALVAFFSRYSVLIFHDCSDINPFSGSATHSESHGAVKPIDLNKHCATPSEVLAASATTTEHKHDDCEICGTYIQLSNALFVLAAFTFLISLFALPFQNDSFQLLIRKAAILQRMRAPPTLLCS